MDQQAILVAHEFAIYDDLFDHIPQTEDGGEAKYVAPTEERTPMNARHEKLLELQSLFAKAVIRSELQEADWQRLIGSAESVVDELENLLRHLTGK